MDSATHRLAVNLPGDSWSTLSRVAKARGWSITDAIRRAITILAFVVDARQQGQRLAVIDGTGKDERVREIILLD